MKPALAAIALLFALVTGCSTTEQVGDKDAASETVLVTYHVKPGNEAQLETVLWQAWGIYQQEHLVLPKPHVVLQQKEDDGKTCFVEIFSWVSPEAPDNAPDPVQKVWKQLTDLCESRDNQRAIEFGQVQLVQPSR